MGHQIWAVFPVKPHRPHPLGDLKSPDFRQKEQKRAPVRTGALGLSPLGDGSDVTGKLCLRIGSHLVRLSRDGVGRSGAALSRLGGAWAVGWGVHGDEGAFPQMLTEHFLLLPLTFLFWSQS